MISPSVDPLQAFTDAIQGAGLPAPDTIEADGQLHRFSTNGKASDSAGWYVLHDGDMPAGAFGCWRTGVNVTWCAESDDEMTPAEKRAHQKRLTEIRQQRDKAKRERQEKVSEQAVEIWPQLKPAPADHPYLKSKGIKPHGLRVDDDGLLVVPMYTTDNKLQSWQTIDAEGKKQFPYGGRVIGCCYPIGKIADAVYICEGFATGATIAEAVGSGVVCAFNCGNLKAVAEAVRAKYPEARLVICADNDENTDGNPGITKAKEAAAAAGGVMVSPGIAGDFNDLHKAQGLEVVRKALDPAPALAYESRILERFKEDVQRCGVVGEEKIAATVYLLITSRLLDRPVSCAVKGNSASGKSFTTQATVKFFPKQAVIEMTAMSEHALIYSEEEYSHRMLVLYEATALRENSDDNMTAYFVRSLLSEGRIEYPVTVKVDGEFTTRTIIKEGPTGLIITTCKTKVHAENETRLLSLSTDDSREQTARIFLALADENEADIDLTEWHRLQSWLQVAERRVTIPYGRRLAEMVPPEAIRMRRDFGAILALIKAHAILHQATREKDEQGRIIATLDDYAQVRDLVADIVAEGVAATVSPTVRETVEAVARLSADKPQGVMAKAITEALGIDKAAVSRRLSQAREGGYIRNLEDRRGKAGRWVAGDPMPENADLLPQPINLSPAESPAITGGCAVDVVNQGVKQDTSKQDIKKKCLPSKHKCFDQPPACPALPPKTTDQPINREKDGEEKPEVYTI